MVFITGRLKQEYLRDVEIYVIGEIRASMVISDEVLVVIGGGKIDLIVANTCYLVSRKSPIFVNTAYCGSAIILGSRLPVAINYLRTRKLYARKAYVDKLEAVEAVLGELCVVNELEQLSKVIFTDSHLYIKKAGSIKEVLFAYKPVQD